MTSNQVQKVLGSISKLLECAICLDLLKNPIATRCHHHFCRFCITEFLKTKTHVPCPLCKEPVTRRSLQDQDRLSDIVEHVRGLITAYQEDTGEFFSPSRGHLGTDFFPCTPEPIFPRETTASKRQARRGGKQATRRVDSPGDAGPAGSHAQHEETTEKLETRLHPPALHLRNTGSTGTRNIRKTRRSRQDHVSSHGGEERVGDGDRRESDERRMSALEQEGDKLETGERHMSALEQEAALLKYLVEGSCGVNKGMTVSGDSVGTDKDSSIKVLSGVGATGDASDERSTGHREARAGEGNDMSCDGAVVIDVDECLNNETKSAEAKTLGNKEIVERKGDNSCIETMDIDMNECFKTETKSVGNNSTVGSKGFSPVCVGVEEKDGRLTPTSEKHLSRIEQILQLTPETEYEGERCGSDVSGDGGLLFQSQEVKKKEKPTKSKLSIYTGQAARGTTGGKNKTEATQKSQYETDFHEGSPLSSMDAPNLTKDFHSVGPVKTYSKAQVRKHQKSSMVAQWIEEAQHATGKGNFSQNDSLASNHGNMVSRNTGNCEPIAINADSEVENFGFSVSESNAAGGSRPNVANSVEGTQESRQSTQAPPANRRRMFKTRGTKETEVVSTGKKTTESELPSSDPYEFKSSQTVHPKQKIQKQRGRKPGKKKRNKFSLKMADLQTKEASSSEVGGGVESDMTTKKDKSKASKHVHFALKSPDQELSSLIEKIGDAEDHDFAFCTQDAVSNMAEQGGDGAQLVEGFGDVMNEDIEMIDCDDTVKGSFGNGPADNLKSQTTNSSSSNSNDTEKSQTMSIIPPTPILSAATGQPVTSIPSSHMAQHPGQASKVTTDHRNDEVHLTDSDSCSQMPLPIPRKKSKSAGRETKTDAKKLDVGDVASLAESSGQSHISPTPSVELVHQQDVNTARQDNDVTQDDLPSSGNSSSTEDLNISLENTQFEEANLDIQPDEIKKQLSQMSEDSQLSKAEGCPVRHRDGSTVKDTDGDKTPSQGRPSSSTSKQRNTEERQSVVSLNQAPSQCGQSSAGRIHHKAQERQCIVSDNPGCPLADQCSEDEVETIAADTATTMCNVPHNSHNSHSSHSVTNAENMGAANSGSVIAKHNEDSCEDSGMAVGIEKLGVPDGKSQSEDAIPESIEEESVNLIEDTDETSRGRSTRSLRTRAGTHEAAGSATTCKSRVSQRSSNRNKDPVIEIAWSDTEEAVAICDVTDSRQEKPKLKDPVQGICLVDSQASTLPTSLPVGCDELTLPPDVCVGDDQEAADVVEVDGGATEASVDVPETVTESLSLLEQPDEQDVTPGRSGEASTLESVSILKNSDIDFKTSRTRNKNNQQKDSTGKEICQNTQAVDRRSNPQKRKRLEADDGEEDTSALHQLQDSAEAPSIPEVSSAPVTITLDDSDDEPLVIHRPKRKCFSLDGSPLRARPIESRTKLSRRAKPSAKKSLEAVGTCVNVDHEPMDTDVRGTVVSSNCKGHSLDENSDHDKKSEFDIVSAHHKQQCVDDTPQLVNTMSDSSQVQESMEDIFNRNTEQSLNIVIAGADDASQNTLVPTCNDDDHDHDHDVDSPTRSPEQATVKERKSQFLDADSSDSDSPQTPRLVKKGVKAARGLASLKKKQPSKESASSPIVISSSKSSSGRMPDSVNQDIRVKSQSTSSQERCPPAKQQLSLTDSECVGPTPSDVTHAGPGSGSRSRKMKGADSMRRNKNVLASDNEDVVSGCELSGRSKREGNGLKQRHKGERASRVSLPLIHPSTEYKAKSKRRTKHVLSSDDDDEVAAVESSGCELSGRSKSEPSGHKRRYRVNCEINLPKVQSSIEDKADDDIVVLDDFEEPVARTECSSSDEEFVLRDDDEVIRKADMPEGDAMFADLPQTSSPVHASSPVPDPEDESDEAPVGVRKISRHAIITDSDSDDDDDDDDDDDGDQQMNFTSSSAFSSQSDVLTTQQQGKLEKDLEKMREEIRRLEAMKDDGAGEDVDGTMVEVAEDVAEADIVEENCKVSTPDVIPASNKTKDGDDSSSDDDLFLSPRSPSPPPDFDRLPKPRKSAEIIKAFEIIEKFKSPDRSKSSRSRTVLSPLQTGNLGQPRSEKIVIITSGLNREQATSVQEFSKVTGSVFFPKFNKTVTHLVVKKAAGESRPVCDRTLKYFQGIVGKCWVVSFDWVRDSLLANKPLPEDKYEIVGDTVIVEDHHGPRRSRTSDKKLFSGFTLTCIGVSDEMTKDDMSLLLQQGGATLADDPWELGKMAAAIPLIIRCLDTEDEAPTKSEVEHFNCFYKHNRLITVSREWVLDSISTWRLQPLDDYVLNNIKNIVLPF